MPDNRKIEKALQDIEESVAEIRKELADDAKPQPQAGAPPTDPDN